MHIYIKWYKMAFTIHYKKIIPNISFHHDNYIDILILGAIVDIDKNKTYPSYANILDLSFLEDELPGTLAMASALRNAFIQKIPVSMTLELAWYIDASRPHPPGYPSPYPPGFWLPFMPGYIDSPSSYINYWIIKTVDY
jgi:hypothetical protein